MPKTRKGIWLLVFLFFAGVQLTADECSTAVIGAGAAQEGRPLLWKNRDTDKLSNKVVFVSEVPYSYIGIVDSDAPSGRMVWAGVNTAGLAIFNSVAYNLPQKSAEMKDLEGLIMAEALRTCRSVDDFEAYLKKNTGPDLGSRANFGLIDGQGGAALFETHNHGFKRLDVAQTAEKYLLNTNFSRSGEAEEGRGYVRFSRLEALFRQAAEGKLSLPFILQTAARDLGHPLLQHPGPADWAKLPARPPRYLYSAHTINRASTACAIVVQGVDKGGDPADVLLWIIPGEPVCGIALPLWVAAGQVPAEFSSGEMAPFFAETWRLKKLLRPYQDVERSEYLDLTRLDNREASGWLPRLLQKERVVFQKTDLFLKTKPDRAQKAAFQKEVAAEVLAFLKSIR